MSDDSKMNSISCESFSRYSNINQEQSILEFKPKGKLYIQNFEYNKTFNEKIQIKNLVNFPLSIYIRPSDSRKLEILNYSNKYDKTVKINGQGTFSLEIGVRVDHKTNLINKKESIKLFIWFNNNIIDYKYSVEFHQLLQLNY